LRFFVAITVLAVFLSQAHCKVKKVRHSDPAPPIFPNDWTAHEEDFSVIHQGKYKIQGDDYCCTKNGGQCQVQTQYDNGMQYTDYTNNRTRFDDTTGQGTDVTLFYPKYMDMNVDANNTCVDYCPVHDDMRPYQINVNATDLGQKVVDNRTCEEWEWYQTFEGIIVMETFDVYVDSATGYPYQEIDTLTPFGEYVGDAYTTYHTFTAGTPDPKLFDIKGVDSCPMAHNCQQPHRQLRRLKNRMWKTFMHYHKLSATVGNSRESRIASLKEGMINARRNRH